MDTLVLNTAYQPIRYVSWQEAFCLWFSGRVEVVDFHSDRTIKTTSEVFKIPSIIRFIKGLFKRNKLNKSAKFSRKNVMVRDNYECQYCKVKLDKKNYTLDHIVPASRGGKTNWKNIVCCCATCNQKKGNRTPAEAGMKLLKEPKTPESFEIINKSITDLSLFPQEWRDYLGGNNG